MMLQTTDVVPGEIVYQLLDVLIVGVSCQNCWVLWRIGNIDIKKS